MDRPKSCINKCIFCFIDQLPKGLRKTLYFKDDDARMSFLLGNYVSLTNLSEEDVKRIIRMRISPINISVHTTNPALRDLMLGNPKGGKSLEIIEYFAGAEITMNCQVVVCPGINDGDELKRTLLDLTGLYPAVQSISVVPVGITKYRDGLYPLKGVDREAALRILDICDEISHNCRSRHGFSLVYCGDELYLKAGRAIPEPAAYDGYPQLENGVGSMAAFEEESLDALENAEGRQKTMDLRSLPVLQPSRL